MNTNSKNNACIVRNLLSSDFQSVINLCLKTYPTSPPWTQEQLNSHITVFPEGQLVAIQKDTGALIGYASSLIILWDDYDPKSSWRDFTDHGYFKNHDPANGRTLYGAEIMVDPDTRGQGVGKQLYAARDAICRAHKLLRIRAGARLRGYSKHKEKMSAEEYLKKVTRGELTDSTLTFQLKRGFKVLDLVQGYLRYDPESLGYAALIESLNPEVAKSEDYEKQKQSRFYY